MPAGRRDAPPARARLSVRVQPRASRDEVLGWQGGVLRVRVTAPPVEGEANAALAGLLAGALGVRPTAVSVVRGHRGRDKQVDVVGLDLEEIRRRLMKGLALVLASLCLLLPAVARAEHTTDAAAWRSSSVDVDVEGRFERDGFRLGGQLVTPLGVFGAWLSGARTAKGFTLGGRFRDPDKSFDVTIDTDAWSVWTK